MNKAKQVVPTLVLTAGILAGTAIAVALQASWLALAGALVLAGAILVARLLDRGADSHVWRGGIRSAEPAPELFLDSQTAGTVRSI
jgi:hypothetical protein